MSIGRAFLYALNYGQDGVEHFIDSESMLHPGHWLLVDLD